MLATTRLDGELVCGRRVCLRGRQLARKEAFSSDARCARDEAGARPPPLRFLAELATTPPDADRGAFSRQSAARLGRLRVLQGKGAARREPAKLQGKRTTKRVSLAP